MGERERNNHKVEIGARPSVVDPLGICMGRWGAGRGLRCR